MNREDIIKLAREAEVIAPQGYQGTWMWGHDNLERFAALVAAEIGIAQHRRGYESGLRDGAEGMLDPLLDDVIYALGGEFTLQEGGAA